MARVAKDHVESRWGLDPSRMAAKHPWIRRGVAGGLQLALFSSLPWASTTSAPSLFFGEMLLVWLFMGLLFGVGAEIFVRLGNSQPSD
jgi:hypothetical protein